MICCVLFGKIFLTAWHQSGSHSIAKRREGRRRRNREIEKWEEAVLGSMMEDTKEETGREREWREETSIVGGIWRAQWRGMRWQEEGEKFRGGQGGNEEGRGNGGRQRGGEGKREGEEMMRNETIKKRGEIGRRRGTGWQGGEV